MSFLLPSRITKMLACLMHCFEGLERVPLNFGFVFRNRVRNYTKTEIILVHMNNAIKATMGEYEVPRKL
jgi:hypothetical protein